ncbi:lactamase [Dehalococcoides mccartyi]|uniref:MBL fold metallo-hydrolase n=1 Tax=Dehalococcoides mccartyi TaxID=61435 RepID=UPI00073AEDE9|nr:MBL fold metallo-hydrolase [Dehalococcoides mccartyi]KSV16600.1 lactamase [Dehalococcoides mccartyi]
MRITVHRGTHEIGGSCVEVVSNSRQSRIILDFGMPLVNHDLSPFMWDEHKHLSQEKLLLDGILPNIPGLFDSAISKLDGVLLSHAHIDHYGFFSFVNPQVPLFMSPGTKSLAEVSNIFLDTNVRLENVKLIKMWESFKLGEFVITPYLMDHSAPDAVAFLIEADDQRLFYTGDFRGHGRKAVLLDRLTKNPPPNIDCLLMEGSMLGRSEGLYSEEDAVEEALFKLFRGQNGPAYVFTSSQNLDRLVSLYRAARRAGKTLVIDLYTAFVLDKLSIISSSIPQFSWDGMRVLFSHYHAQKLADEDKQLLYKYVRSKIEFEAILANPDDKVLLAKDSRYFRGLIVKLKQARDAIAVYSMWHGYLEKTDLKGFLDANGIKLTEIHTSGHAYVNHLKKLVEALKPRYVVPIHTFYPEKYKELFPNVVQLKDGEIMNLDTMTQPAETRCRALSTSFLQSFNLTDGLYKPLVDLVRKNKDLHFEFRGQLHDSTKPWEAPADEAIGIYYKGNSILGLHSNHKVEIHDAFTKDLTIPKYLHTVEDVQTYIRHVPELMFRVASRGKKSMEIEYEQMIIRANNLEERNNSEYIILANQYSIGEERWDLLSLKWPRKRRGGNNPVGQLALIEVKYALNSDIQDADQQLGRYYDYISKNIESLCVEMELILSQKLFLGLIERTPEQLAQLQKLKLSRDINKVEMILYLVDYNPNSIWKDKMIKKAMLLPFKNQIRIKIGGLAMWEQSSTPLKEAAKQLQE